jgi:hypothetical protein
MALFYEKELSMMTTHNVLIILNISFLLSSATGGSVMIVLEGLCTLANVLPSNFCHSFCGANPIIFGKVVP